MRRARTYRWTRMRPYRARFREQGVFFAFQSWAGCITNIFGFDLRQTQVFDLIVVGNTNKHIARALGGTERTIKAHRQQVMEKLQVRTLAELVSLAERVGAASATGQTAKAFLII